MPTPVCGKCNQPHFNFVACANVSEWEAKRPVKAPEEPLSAVIKSVPEGYKKPSGWGQGGWGGGFGGGFDTAA